MSEILTEADEEKSHKILIRCSWLALMHFVVYGFVSYSVSPSLNFDIGPYFWKCSKNVRWKASWRERMFPTIGNAIGPVINIHTESRSRYEEREQKFRIKA
jgi:hypothetical protein